MIKIREFEKSKREYNSIVKIHNSIWPKKFNVEDFIKSDQNRDENQYYKRFVAELNGEIVAYGICRDPWEFSNPGYYFMNITVDKNFRHQGIGGALYKTIIQHLKKKERDTLMTETYEDFVETIAFLKKRGFKQNIRLPRSLLSLEQFNISKWEQILNLVEKQGIEIMNLVEFSKRFEDWKRKIWKLHIQCMKDVPSTVEFTEMPFDQYDKTVLGELDLQFWLVALDQEKPIGMSILWYNDVEPEKLYTSLTGVLRMYRRKKIATAMKIVNICQAKQTPGISVIETENEENNPMFQLNLQLGFKAQPAKLGFEKKFN